jgi:hypothetical protein
MLQELSADAEFFEKEAKWLQTTSNEFGSSFKESNSERLRNICRRFETIKPTVKASNAGDVSCLAFEFRDSATKQINWLETLRSSMPDIAHGSSSADSLRSALVKYEVRGIVSYLKEPA